MLFPENFFMFHSLYYILLFVSLFLWTVSLLSKSIMRKVSEIEPPNFSPPYRHMSLHAVHIQYMCFILFCLLKLSRNPWKDSPPPYVLFLYILILTYLHKVETSLKLSSTNSLTSLELLYYFCQASFNLFLSSMRY